MENQRDPSKTALVDDPVDDMDWMVSESDADLLTPVGIDLSNREGLGSRYEGAADSSWAMPAGFDIVVDSDLPLDLPELAATAADSPVYNAEDYPLDDLLTETGNRHQETLTEPAAVSEAMTVSETVEVAEEAASEVSRPEFLRGQGKHIIFSLTGKRYAVPIRNVVEVGELSNLTPVPNVPHWVRGVTNLRGDIISVVDFRAFLGIGQELRPELGSMIVVRALEGDLTTALLVDRDLGMTTVSAEQLQ
ncbi:MAG TPA: chemotaxis protein CheW, partial [Blastocatellia bacterium]|nr:chemotaxis protein CheW [Blastocatellia bacterium]